MEQFFEDLMTKLKSYHSDIDRLFGDMFMSKSPVSYIISNAFHPATDVIETEEEIIVRIEIPGIDKDCITIVFHSGFLLVKGRRRELDRTKKMRFKQMEINYGMFGRIMKINTPVDVDNITANYRNGFLDITLPKTRVSSEKKISVIIEDVG